MPDESNKRPGQSSDPPETGGWDHSTQDAFFGYYANESRSEHTVRRFTAYRDIVLRLHSRGGEALDVADIGCGAGTQSFLWAALGHRVHGLDVSEELVHLARRRADATGAKVNFSIGSATRLPWADRSMDVCLAVELLEHVADWQTCLSEFTRILRPQGVLFLTTTNTLCPKQQEFDLPLYSWYPRPLKRHYERLARTTRPELVTYATYPAVNWFTFYGLRRELKQRGCRSFDRFDVIELPAKSRPKRLALRVIRAVGLARFLAHVATPSTWAMAVKK
jgi:2-polyprenyl-3-methyl-5-hydroxy-6-metoxy-1,4-benzoquinol methylase